MNAAKELRRAAREAATSREHRRAAAALDPAFTIPAGGSDSGEDAESEVSSPTV